MQILITYYNNHINLNNNWSFIYCCLLFHSTIKISGFEGFYCSNNINDCFDASCSEGKVCYDLINSYECRCPEGFTGENCSVNIDECESSPCLNGGECHDGMANYSCVCPPGYTGNFFFFSTFEWIICKFLLTGCLMWVQYLWF